jgi:hypothetical protein
MKFAALALCPLLSACATTSVSEAPIEAQFAGTWTGTATLALTGKSPLPYTLALKVALSTTVATVGELCPGLVRHESLRTGIRVPTEASRFASASVDMTGSGASASWSGTLECPRTGMSGCDSMGVTYTAATATLTGSNQLTVVATGNAEGCNVTYPVLLTFVGVKSLQVAPW